MKSMKVNWTCDKPKHVSINHTNFAKQWLNFINNNDIHYTNLKQRFKFNFWVMTWVITLNTNYWTVNLTCHDSIVVSYILRIESTKNIHFYLLSEAFFSCACMMYHLDAPSTMPHTCEVDRRQWTHRNTFL